MEELQHLVYLVMVGNTFIKDLVLKTVQKMAIFTMKIPKEISVINVIQYANLVILMLISVLPVIVLTFMMLRILYV